ncbi:MBL fold metallo-hydrolase, partial [Vibrio owensii]
MSETTLKNTYLARERATQSLITPHTYYAQLAHRINHSAQFEHGRVKDKMPKQAMRVTWLGHSTLMIETDGVRILTDPVFDYASPLIAKAWFERNVPNTAVRDSLPIPDVIVISHDHYDHLEASTIRYYSD